MILRLYCKRDYVYWTKQIRVYRQNCQLCPESVYERK